MISNEFKSIHIDLEKGIYLLNGKEIKMISFMQLEFDNGEWSLETTKTELCSSKSDPKIQVGFPLGEELQTIEFRSGGAALILPVISLVLAIASLILLYL